MSKRIKLGNLSISIDETGDSTLYRFEGDVDEFFRFSEIPTAAGTKATFDLSQINNFNSCGIREWVHFMRGFSKNTEIHFVRCSVTMVDQINMVPDTMSGARVESFYAPYYRTCEDCYPESEVNCLIDVATHWNFLVERVAPDFKCDKCQAPMEFDALEDSYFIFVTQSVEQAS